MEPRVGNRRAAGCGSSIEGAMAERKYWLLKSEPTEYSYSDLLGEPDQTAEWDGVRNFQARNFLRDQMKAGDGVLFYHSSNEVLGVVGIAEIVREGYPDDTAFDTNSGHYDPKSTPDSPIWYVVDIKAGREFARPVTLAEIKVHPKLQDMMLIRRGMRLSIQPVAKAEWDEIVALGG